MFIAIPLSRHVKEQIDKTDAILNELKPFLVNPIVAGGAPRDWYFNVKGKDIDIFVDPQETTQLIGKITELGCTEITEQTGEGLPEQYRSNYITTVISFKYQREAIQIIVKNTTESPLVHFPCSLCLITYKDFSINPTQEFLDSVQLGKIDILDTCNMKYIKKITKRFYAYELRVVRSFRFNIPEFGTRRRTGNIFDDTGF